MSQDAQRSAQAPTSTKTPINFQLYNSGSRVQVFVLFRGTALVRQLTASPGLPDVLRDTDGAWGTPEYV